LVIAVRKQVMAGNLGVNPLISHWLKLLLWRFTEVMQELAHAIVVMAKGLTNFVTVEVIGAITKVTHTKTALK